MRGEVRVAAVNLDVSSLWCPEAEARPPEVATAFAATLARLGGRAADEGAQVVLFPALSGMLCTAEGAQAVRRWGEGQAPEVTAKAADAWREATLEVLAELARGRGLHVIASWLAADAGEGRFAHEAVVIGPDGEVLGRQAQTHATCGEADKGLAPAGLLAPVETSLGRWGLALGTDAWYPEVSRILALSGADVLFFPQAVAAPYPFWRQVAGAWQEVQQNQVFGVESGLTGGRFLGRAAVFGPCELTPGETGQLAGVGLPYGAVEAIRQPVPGESEEALRKEALVVAALDFERLAAVRRQYPIFAMLNPDAYQPYFPGIYERPAGEGNGS